MRRLVHRQFRIYRTRKEFLISIHIYNKEIRRGLNAVIYPNMVQHTFVHNFHVPLGGRGVRIRDKVRHRQKRMGQRSDGRDPIARLNRQHAVHQVDKPRDVPHFLPVTEPFVRRDRSQFLNNRSKHNIYHTLSGPCTYKYNVKYILK